MLDTKIIGFIGSGNMGEALIRGLIGQSVVDPDQIWCADVRPERLEIMGKRHGIHTSRDNEEVIQKANMVIYAVKPQVLGDVIRPSAKSMDPSKIIVSIAAGVPLRAMAPWLPENTRLIRAMPNMCVTVQQGVTALVAGAHATAGDIQLAQNIFNAVGRSIVLKDEALMDAVTGLSGSGPAYIFIILDALADAGVHMGLPREEALLLAAQTIMGAATVYLDTGMHPGQLKDLVTSPAGTTIVGIGALEKGGIRHALRDAVEQATVRSRELGRMMFQKPDKA